MSLPDAEIAATILRLLEARAEGATICPSDAARALSHDEATWRALMPEVRRVADELRTQGLIRILAKGQELASAQDATGPIRLGHPSK